MRAALVVRDVDLYGECPKCGTPGLHKMPERRLMLKLPESRVSAKRDRYEDVHRRYSRRGYRAYSYGDVWDYERTWLEEAREEYHAALKAARVHRYVLARECYVDDCRHAWFELIREFESDLEAAKLQDRYPQGLVVVD